MEDHEAQEQEFWRKLQEEEISRSQMLRRSAAAAIGLTAIATPSLALAARRAAAKTPPVLGRTLSLAEFVKEAKKEGKLNVIALPHDWSNYGEVISTFKKKFGLSMDEQNPNGSSAQENEAVRSLKGDPRAPDVVDVSPPFAIDGANEGLYAKYYTTNFRTVPRNEKDGRGFWVGDYWGVISIGANKGIVKNIPKTFADLLKPEYKNQVALNGSPLTSGSARAIVFAAAIANGGSLDNVQPGIDFWAKMKQIGNYIPVGGTPQTVASGQTPIVLDWDYLNIAYGAEFPAAKWVANIPVDGVYGAYYCQACSATAPHPWAARLWQEFLYSDQGQLLFLKGFAHPARFPDMVARKVVPAALIKALPSPALYAKVKFANRKQNNDSKALILDQWPKKVGG